MTTEINTILNANWDTGIVTKPDFITTSEDNMHGYTRVIATDKVLLDRTVVGIGLNRRYYDEDSYEMYECIIRSTSKADAYLMIQAIEKVCTTYTPTATENILEWSPAELTNKFNNVFVEYTMTISLRKAGKDSY